MGPRIDISRESNRNIIVLHLCIFAASRCGRRGALSSAILALKSPVANVAVALLRNAIGPANFTLK